MLHLVLAVACSLGVGALFKEVARRGLDRRLLVPVNYGVALVLGVSLGRASGSAVAGGGADGALWGLGVATGALFVAGFRLLGHVTEAAGMALALGVMRLSVVVPVAAAWALWGEAPTAGQGVGLALAAAAFVLLAWPASAASPEARAPGECPASLRRPAGLAALFAVGGLADTALKAFDVGLRGRHAPETFLAVVFGTAFVLSAALAVPAVSAARRGGARVPWGAVALVGGALGAANYGATAALLAAVARLPAAFAFPANSVAIVLGGAGLGVLWGERLGPTGWVGVALAAAALGALGR